MADGRELWAAAMATQGQVVFDGTAAQLTEEAQSALYAKSSPANMGSQFDSPSQSKEFLPC